MVQIHRKTKTQIIQPISCILLILLLFSSVALAAQPYIGDDGKYTKNVNMGEKDNFNWTVYRNDNLTYVVSVSVSGFEKWDQSISPSYFVLDNQEPYHIVTLSFIIPSYPEREQRNATVTFMFREINSSSSINITKKVDVHVVGVSPTGYENYIIGTFENPLPEPFNTPFGTLIVNIVIWFVIAWLTYFLIKRFILVFTKKTKTKFDDILIDIIRRPIILLIAVYGTITSVLQVGINIGLRETIYELYSFIVVIIGMYVAVRAFNEFIEEFSRTKGAKKGSFNTVLKPVFKKIGLVFIITVGLIFALNVLGINVTALLAGAGVAGLVIAFAAQDTLSNFFSGMHLLLDRPFLIGDIILLESGEYCRVENVGMRSTKLYSIFNHELIILPNNAIANQKIINVVKPDNHIKGKLTVGVSYGSDVKKVMKILYDVAMNHKNVLKDKDFLPVVRFTEFDNSSLNFLIIVWIDDVMNQWEVLSDMREQINIMFKKEGIEIPFPQRTVWLHTINKQPALKDKSGRTEKKK